MDKKWFTTELKSTENKNLIFMFKFIIGHYNLIHKSPVNGVNFNRDSDMQCLRYTIPIFASAELKNMIAVAVYTFFDELTVRPHRANILKIVEYLSIHYRTNFNKAAENFIYLTLRKLRICIPFDEISDKVLTALNVSVYSYYRYHTPTSLETEQVNLTTAQYAAEYLRRYKEFEIEHLAYVRNVNMLDITGHHKKVLTMLIIDDPMDGVPDHNRVYPVEEYMMKIEKIHGIPKYW